MTDVRIATRRSELALAQARAVGQMLMKAAPGTTVRLVEVVTSGDRDQTGPIAELTEVGAFVRGVQTAVSDGRADLAVHSLKDLPVAAGSELELVAYPQRQPPWDVLVGSQLADLAAGARIGTGSPRRSSQLRLLRPDLTVSPIRGNVDTRLAKVATGEFDAAVMAEAGLLRVGRADDISHRFTTEEMVPAPGQGTLAVEARPDSEMADLARLIDDPQVRELVTAERELLALTGAGCRAALGACARPDGDGIRLDAFVDDESGPRRASVVGATPDDAAQLARKELGL